MTHASISNRDALLWGRVLKNQSRLCPMLLSYVAKQLWSLDIRRKVIIFLSVKYYIIIHEKFIVLICVFIPLKLYSTTSTEVIIISYFALFQSHMRYALLAWGDSFSVHRIFAFSISKTLCKEHCKQDLINVNIIIFHTF